MHIKIVRVEPEVMPTGRVTDAQRQQYWASMGNEPHIEHGKQLGNGSGYAREDGWKYLAIERPDYTPVVDRIVTALKCEARRLGVRADIDCERFGGLTRQMKRQPVQLKKVGDSWLKGTDLLIVLAPGHQEVTPVAAARPNHVRHIFDQHPDCRLGNELDSDRHVSHAVRVLGTPSTNIHFHGMATEIAEVARRRGGMMMLNAQGIVGNIHEPGYKIRDADWIDVDVDGLAQDKVRTMFVPGTVRVESVLEAIRNTHPGVVSLAEYVPRNDFGGYKLPALMAVEAFRAKAHQPHE